MSEAGFTLVEVVIALVIIALTAAVLLDRRVEIVSAAGRARDQRTAWTLASRKVAELELDRSLWQGEGAQSSGSFGEYDSAYAPFTWEYLIVRMPVDTSVPWEAPDPTAKPKELFRLGLKVEAPGLTEPVVLEALFPTDQGQPPAPPAAVGAPPAGPGPSTPPGPSGPVPPPGPGGPKK